MAVLVGIWWRDDGGQLRFWFFFLMLASGLVFFFFFPFSFSVFLIEVQLTYSIMFQVCKIPTLQSHTLRPPVLFQNAPCFFAKEAFPKQRLLISRWIQSLYYYVLKTFSM